MIVALKQSHESADFVRVPSISSVAILSLVILSRRRLGQDFAGPANGV
jgi:hypothetical protein